MQYLFHEIGRLPEPGDNVAIASRILAPGSAIVQDGSSYVLPFQILEGHRFATVPIQKGEALLSWGLPFGFATREIRPGDYVCNEKILHALRDRHVQFALPTGPNFEDYRIPYQLDEGHFRPGTQVRLYPETRSFAGFGRNQRGVGTRNYVIILGTSSWTSSFVREVAGQFARISSSYPNIDGVVAVAHTEGGTARKPNNFDLLLRTLSGFIVNPNVGAVLAVDTGAEALSNRVLQQFMAENHYPIADLPAAYLTAGGNHRGKISDAAAIVQSLLPKANACARSSHSIAHLKIGLQCGGSDAFSGVSGNPLVGWVSRELVRYGGSANLAETDELIGAEPYILRNVRDLPTARAFVRMLERFQERAAWHGHSAEGNPSGGNNYRGLYNIAVKSIGAARKKAPDVRIDHVIEYGQGMADPGFYFMDSPGNDLESIAGQVAAGCNLILFTTGNGSITNFPFVPTLKYMTTTGRFQLLARDMDFNAGRYQDGVPMEDLGREAFEQMLAVASGTKSVGEKAGHAQVQLWREWRLAGPPPRTVDPSQPKRQFSGQPLPIAAAKTPPAHSTFTFQGWKTSQGISCRQVGLIVPTSLCAGQVGNMIAARLNARDHSPGLGEGFVALAHTEGCGVSGGDSEELSLRVMAGYVAHPSVRRVLVLEHGCEKTHNDALRNSLDALQVDQSRLGWASVQLDGGIEQVSRKIAEWFTRSATEDGPPERVPARLGDIRLGFTATGPTPSHVAAALAEFARALVAAGGCLVLPENCPLLRQPEFRGPLILAGAAIEPTLEFGAMARHPGFHIMESATDHHVELLTGLGATGVEILLSYADHPVQGHPLIPLIQIASTSSAIDPDDIDLALDPATQPGELVLRIVECLVEVASGRYNTKCMAQRQTDFQMTRGPFGVSL